MNRKLLVVACAGLLALAGCQPEPADTAADTAAAATDAVPAAVEPGLMAEATPSDATPTFDQKGFAGTFSGTVPCADCPGIDATLALSPDGTFVLTQDRQGDEAGDGQVDGTWTAEADDTLIRLDPNSKTAEDQLYAITSNDVITQLGGDGQPADVTLTRAPAAN